MHVYRKIGKETIYMHHMVIGKPPVGLITDHINRNGLDNQRENLQHVTRRTNALNSDRSDNAKIIEKSGNKYRLRPFIDGVRTNLGVFNSEAEALIALERHRNDR